jgi:hypothetical protein
MYVLAMYAIDFYFWGVVKKITLIGTLTIWTVASIFELMIMLESRGIFPCRIEGTESCSLIKIKRKAKARAKSFL